MKHFILSSILLFFSVAASHAQESTNAGSGDVAAANLSMSYSIGQAFTEPVAYTAGSVTPGIQQPYKIDVASGLPNVAAELKMQAYPNPATSYSDWGTDAGSSAEILNKPTIPNTFFGGDYNDLTNNQPVQIPAIHCIGKLLNKSININY
jgi:hypothetical protein